MRRRRRIRVILQWSVLGWGQWTVDSGHRDISATALAGAGGSRNTATDTDTDHESFGPLALACRRASPSACGPGAPLPQYRPPPTAPTPSAVSSTGADSCARSPSHPAQLPAARRWLGSPHRPPPPPRPPLGDETKHKDAPIDRPSGAQRRPPGEEGQGDPPRQGRHHLAREAATGAPGEDPGPLGSQGQTEAGRAVDPRGSHPEEEDCPAPCCRGLEAGSAATQPRCQRC